MNKEYTPAEAKAWLNGYDAGKAFAKKEWINLTVQEREKIRDEYGDNPSGLISVVQMMLKEKNYE